MSLFKPPTPVLIASGGGGGGGTAINNASSSVAINTDTSTGEDKIQIVTNQNVAVIVDNNQNVIIGQENANPTKKLTVSAPLGQCIQLINETNNSSTNLITNSDGGLSVTTTGLNIQFGSNDVYINPNSLHIGPTAVIATAAQLNYNAVTPGTASAIRALVVDNNRNISNINSLTAASLFGIIQTGSQPNITSLNSVNIGSLSLNGYSVQSSAIELNYLQGVIPGTAKSNKALVIDSSKNISGINLLNAITLVGTLQTSTQPNITSVGTLNGLSVNGLVGIGTTNPTKTLDIVATSPSIRISTGSNGAELLIDSSGNFKINPDNDIVVASHKNMLFSGSSTLSGLNSLVAINLTGTLQTGSQPNITAIGALSALNVNGDTIIGRIDTTTAAQRLIIREQNGQCLRLSRTFTIGCDLTINAQGDLELKPYKDVRIISGAALRMAGAITGVSDLTANTLTGAIQTPDQPNITSIGTLSSLNVSNNITAYSVISTNVTGTLQTSSQPNITLIGTLSNLDVSNRITATNVVATTLTGTLQTSSQPNITSVGTLSSLNVSNGITASSVSAGSLTGTIQTSSQPNITSVGTLSSLNVSNAITASSVSASSLTGTIQTGSQPNITSIGTLSSLNVSNTINASSLVSSTLTGTLQTGSQPNITSVGTLSSLNVTNTINASSVSAGSLSGTLQTGSQPNITSIGVLNKLSTGCIGIGVINPSCAIDINTSDLEIDPIIKLNNGTINGSIRIDINGLLIDTNGDYLTLGTDVGLRFMGGEITGLSSLTATSLNGTIQTSDQPNITRIGTLSYLDSGYLGLGTESSDQYRLKLFDENGKMITMSDGSSSMIISMIGDDYTINTSNNRLALGPDVNLVLNGGTIIGLDNLETNNITGTLQTASQPNITSVGTLSELIVNGGISAENATLDSIHITGDVVVDGELILSIPLSFSNLSSSTGSFDANIAATSSTNGGTLTVTGGAAFSENVYIGTSLTIGNATITQSSISALSGGTPGTVTPEVYISADNNKDLTGFRNLTSDNFYGTIQTSYQPIITTVGNLLNLNVSGYLGVGTLSPIKQLEINSTTGDCLRLTYNKTSAYVDVLVDSSGNATIAPTSGLLAISSKISTQQILLGNTTNTIMPLEIGYTPFTMTQSYAFNTSTNSHGTFTSTSTASSYNYSIRALGRILCTQSVDVMSDKRTKTNIIGLTEEFCESFIKQTNPVSFNWIDGDSNKAYGYIAQDLIRAGFHDLVNLTKDDSVDELIDDDGFINPAGVKFTISYQHIIPILAKNQERLIRENEELKAKLEKILEMLQFQ